MSIISQDPPVSTCPPWCGGHATPGDHSPDFDAWPSVVATAYSTDDTPTLQAFPTWGEVDGLSPAVSLALRMTVDNETVDLTPCEALDLATSLLRASRAALEVRR